MTITTTKIATISFIAAITAGVTEFVSVISAAVSSRLRWRHVVGGIPVSWGNQPGVLRHQLAWLAGLKPAPAMQPAKRMAASCRPSDAGFGNRPNYSVARQLVVS